MKLLSVNVGRIQNIEWNGKVIPTAIFKSPASGPVEIHGNNLKGDEQADPRFHGGTDKAVYAYSFDAYPAWERALDGEPLIKGALGENLTIDRFDEKQICVGDIFEIGTCVLQVVQPRVPCFKLGVRFDNPNAVRIFTQISRSGLYFRVLKEGALEAGQTIKVIPTESVRFSIDEFFKFVMDRKSLTQKRAQEITQLKSMNAEWLEKIGQISKI